MSSFYCEECGEAIIDAPGGYVSGCEHYPIPEHYPITREGLKNRFRKIANEIKMNSLSELKLKRELAEIGKADVASKKFTILKQQAWVKDHPKCDSCGSIHNLTYDHIIPAQILSDFNIDATKNFWEENSAVMCFACNHRKNNHLEFRHAKTMPLLKILIEQKENETKTQETI